MVLEKYQTTRQWLSCELVIGKHPSAWHAPHGGFTTTNIGNRPSSSSVLTTHKGLSWPEGPLGTSGTISKPGDTPVSQMHDLNSITLLASSSLHPPAWSGLCQMLICFWRICEPPPHNNPAVWHIITNCSLTKVTLSMERFLKQTQLWGWKFAYWHLAIAPLRPKRELM